MYRLSTALILTAAAVVLDGASARGDFIPWSYSWSADPQVSDGAGGGIKLFTTSGQIQNSKDILGGIFLEAFASGTATSHVLTDALYHLTLHLLDQASGATGDLPFTGSLSGNVLTGGVLNTFHAPLTQSLTLGKNLYTATIGSYSPTGAPSSGQWGTLGADVLVTVPTDASAPINSVPEPAGLVLAGAALLALGAWSWWERKRLRPLADPAA